MHFYIQNEPRIAFMDSSHLWVQEEEECLKNVVLSESMATIMGLLHLRFILNPKQPGFKMNTQMMVYFRFETKNMFSEFDF